MRVDFPPSPKFDPDKTRCFQANGGRVLISCCFWANIQAGRKHIHTYIHTCRSAGRKIYNFDGQRQKLARIFLRCVPILFAYPNKLNIEPKKKYFFQSVSVIVGLFNLNFFASIVPDFSSSGRALYFQKRYARRALLSS